MKVVNLSESSGLVRTSNELIDSSFNLSVLQLRIVWLFASLIRQNDKDFQRYSISISQAIKFLKLHNTNRAHEYLERAIDGLMRQVVHVELPTSEEKKPVWEKYGWVTYSKYDGQSGTIEFKFAEEIKPYLLELANKYTITELEHVLNLSGRYSARLYLILKRFAFQKRVLVEMEKLRIMLGIDMPADRRGKQEKRRFARYQDFRRFVIEQGIREINEKTDLEVSFTPIKTNRKVSHIEFYVQIKDSAADLPPQIASQLKPAHQVIEELVSAGLTPKSAREIWMAHWDVVDSDARELAKQQGEFVDYLRDKIALLKGRKQLKNPGGWLKRAIQQDWKNARKQKPSDAQRATESFAEERRNMESLRVDDRKAAESRRKRSQYLESEYAKLNEEEKTQVNRGVWTRLMGYEEFEYFAAEIDRALSAIGDGELFYETIPAPVRVTAVVEKRKIIEQMLSSS